MYNANSKATAEFTATSISHCNDGYMLMYDSDRMNSNFCSVSSDGKVRGIPVGFRAEYDGPSYSGYSDGLFFANGCFYDVRGNTIIDLTKYNLVKTPYFMNGVCTITFENEGGTRYYAEIDKTGNFIVEPHTGE